MSKRLEGTRNIWITGAGTGIGEAVSVALIEQGHRLIVTGRRQQPLDTLAELAPDRVTSAPADTTDTERLQAMAPELERYGPLNMVILNAGTCEYLEIADYDSQIIANNLNTNVVGTARCLDIALPALRRAKAKGEPATLVIVSSSAWWFPFARAEGYGASKAALTYFAHALRADLAVEGIDVVVVSPGFVKTPLTDRNDFPMPFLVSSEDAANRIVRGLAKGRNEIAFPKRFTWTLRLLGALPRPIIDRMSAAMARQGNN
ncbi:MULTISPECIES: SDR family NAD(P)-dependent oxidoreductase [Marinobacter]|jgi:NAD(P)-dependent dehydrogenase (short-subunit alcohol dehydrogenase family)|uniref:SDR family NAD(P)-dependent oxidoreductase n=1 Tax=Marinobacter TaxID=2742 RepID=UPI0020041B3E|nr:MULTISPECIES: SDR family NAD(P)-dependent oxidoreductase [Marinobacter]MCK7550125.1 SDR family NAD(P)-dependent oxidoreductase [Marinobacter goseongensis]MDV3503641.1 SDR family NAD(P)-dependent oxidoreductase [Marinobacter sp. M-5]